MTFVTESAKERNQRATKCYRLVHMIARNSTATRVVSVWRVRMESYQLIQLRNQVCGSRIVKQSSSTIGPKRDQFVSNAWGPALVEAFLSCAQQGNINQPAPPVSAAHASIELDCPDLQVGSSCYGH